MIFVGIDLAWSDSHPSGLAVLVWDGKRASLTDTGSRRSDDDILAWVHKRSGTQACVSIDAPIIAPNPPGTRREADSELSRDFRRFDAGVYPSNRRIARRAVRFSLKLKALGFSQNPVWRPRTPIKRQIEVYPHSAMVVLFHLQKIIKYKKGPSKSKRKGIGVLQENILAHLPACRPLVGRDSLSMVCREPTRGKKGRSLKDLEDRLDAVICAYSGLYYWYWGSKKCRIYGKDWQKGYIVTPINDEISSFDTGHLRPAH